MISLDDYSALARRVEELKRKRDRAAGAAEERKRQLKEEFGCKTLDEARTLLTKKQKQERKLNEEYLNAKEAFEKKWKDKLDG